MKKAEFVTMLAKDAAITKIQVETVLVAQANAAALAMAEGSELTIPGIVKITTKDRPATTGRNPITGAQIDVPAKRVVRAKILVELKRAVEA